MTTNTLRDGTPLPRAVLYDWDNTLIDSWATIGAAFNHTLETFGLPRWSDAEVRVRVRQSLRDSFPALFGDRWPDAREVYYAHFAAHHIETLQPLAGAEALVRGFAALGVYQAVVSNKTGRFLREEADALGWTGLFGALVGSTDATHDKPHAAAVEKALQPSGLPPSRDIWFVGDTGIDMECAHGAGLYGVVVGDAMDEGLTRFPPDRRFSACQALSDLVVMPIGTISIHMGAVAVERSHR